MGAALCDSIAVWRGPLLCRLYEIISCAQLAMSKGCFSVRR